MHVFLQFTVLGLVFGALYAVTASGLVVTYATTGIFNFAHGAVGMLAAFSYWELTVAHGVPVLLALVLVVGVEAPLLGLVVERLLTRRLHGAGTERSLMVTIGLLLILLGLALEVWGGQTARNVPPYFAADSVTVAGVVVSVQYLIALVVALVVAVGLAGLLRATRFGVAMRAVVDDPELVALAGASPARVAQAGWVLGAVLAAVAGVLVAPLLGQLDQVNLTLFVVNGYAAAVLGRLRSLPTTFVAALGVGLAEQYLSGYLPSGFTNNWLPDPTLALPMVFLFLVLLVVPQDRLETAGRRALTRLTPVPSRGQALVGAAAVVVVALVGAGVLSVSWATTVSQGLVFGIAALSLVLLTGYAGQVSLGQFAFAGIGAFAMGKVAGGGSWWGVLVAVVVSAAVGVLVAVPTVRLRGLYLALATLAFAQFGYYVFFSNGYFFNRNGSVYVHRLALPGISLAGNRAELVLCGVAFAVCAVVVLALRRGIFGRRLLALKDSPAACVTVGVDVARTRLAVFAVAAGMAGLAGALYGTVQGPVGSYDFQLLVSLELLLLLVIWGVRRVTGAFLAGLTYALLSSHASELASLLVGVGIVLIGWLPDGLLGVVHRTGTASDPVGRSGGPGSPRRAEGDGAKELLWPAVLGPLHGTATGGRGRGG